jgi:hypothetical protein
VPGGRILETLLVMLGGCGDRGEGDVERLRDELVRVAGLDGVGGQGVRRPLAGDSAAGGVILAFEGHEIVQSHSAVLANRNKRMIRTDQAGLQTRGKGAHLVMTRALTALPNKRRPPLISTTDGKRFAINCKPPHEHITRDRHRRGGSSLNAPRHLQVEDALDQVASPGSQTLS